MSRTQKQDVLARRKRDKIAEWGNPKLQADISDLETQLKEAEDARDELADVLIQVKYWLLDGLVHNRPVTNPRKILAIVEKFV